MKRALLIAFACFLAILSPAEGKGSLSVQVKGLANQAILGEPLTCTMIWENQGSVPVTMAYNLSFMNPLIQVKLRGPVNKECIVQGFRAEWPEGPHTVIGAGEKQTYSFSPMDFGAVNAGDYEMWLEYDATALEPFWDKYGVNRIRVESNHIRFTVISPQGEDAALFSKYADRCNRITLPPQDILSKSPTSTYAAYVIYGRLQGFSSTDFSSSIFLRALETQRFLSNSYPSESGWISLQGQEAAGYWAKWIGIILKSHPNIWFADELRLKLAVDQAALKNYQVAAADLEALSKQAKEPVAGKASTLLSAMKQKGWIKN